MDDERNPLEQKSMQFTSGGNYDVGDGGIEEYLKSFPPGYHFEPTDLELIRDFLKKKVNNQPLPYITLIPDVNLYSKDPTQFTGWYAEYKPITGFTETEYWYFFSPRDKKHRTAGSKANRSTGNGYWKAIETGKPIYDNAEKRVVGHKRNLDFWEGTFKNSTKIDWKMVEYTLVEEDCIPSPSPKNDMRLNTWVLCKLYKKEKKGEKPNAPQLPCIDSDDHAIDEEPIANQSTGPILHEEAASDEWNWEDVIVDPVAAALGFDLKAAKGI